MRYEAKYQSGWLLNTLYYAKPKKYPSKFLRTADRAILKVCGMKFFGIYFLGQKWIIWTIFDTWQTFLGFSGAILNPYFAFLMTLSQKIVIFIKNQRFHFFTVMNVGWLQWLGRAKILSFRRIWAHITKCLLWNCVIWGPFWSFLT